MQFKWVNCITYALYLDKAVMGGGRERKNKEEEEAEGGLHEAGDGEHHCQRDSLLPPYYCQI